MICTFRNFLKLDLLTILLSLGDKVLLYNYSSFFSDLYGLNNLLYTLQLVGDYKGTDILPTPSAWISWKSEQKATGLECQIQELHKELTNVMPVSKA